VAGYRVYYGTASHSYGQAKGSGLYVTNTTYTVPSLTSGKTYYFAVTAVDASGKESAYSTEATKVMP
jgi:fibronectin type 3 domain-containing protein